MFRLDLQTLCAATCSAASPRRLSPCRWRSALPLALAFGVASGAGAIAGLYGADAAGHKAIVYDFSETAHMDTSMALTVDTVLEQAGEQHIPCFVAGISGTTLATLRGLKVLDRIPEHHRFVSRGAAIEAAVKAVCA